MNLIILRLEITRSRHKTLAMKSVRMTEDKIDADFHPTANRHIGIMRQQHAKSTTLSLQGLISRITNPLRLSIVLMIDKTVLR
jgi:hypothetical protein